MGTGNDLIYFFYLTLLIDRLPCTLRPGKLPSGLCNEQKRREVSGVVVYESHRPRHTSRRPCVGSSLDVRCRFGPRYFCWKTERPWLSLALATYLHGCCAARWEDTLLKTRTNHSHTLIYAVACLMSSGMSKITLLAAFLAVTSSVRAQGTQWYVAGRRERPWDSMLIIFPFVAAPVWHHARPPHHAGEHTFLWTANKRSGIDTVLNMDFVVLNRYGYCPLSTTCFSNFSL